MKKFIIISPNRENNKITLNERYLDCFEKQCPYPIILNPKSSPERYINSISGIMLTGGGDLGQSLLREPLSPNARDIDPVRDGLETALVHMGVKNKIPILGICRGAQVLNSALGGELNQHISGHIQAEKRSIATHEITIDKDTLLYNIINTPKASVNSFHHQCISRPAPCLKISARADDGAAEAAEWHNKGYFCLGVQWHPEELIGAAGEGIIKAFTAACRIYGEGPS